LIDRLAAGDLVAEPGSAGFPYIPANLAKHIVGKAAAPGIAVVAA
jgi:hypothetical protein